MLYAAYETQHAMLGPWRAAARGLSDWLHHVLPDGPAESSAHEVMSGGAIARGWRDH